jgi:glycosyltransferase involved in cell wall biosynthesis
MKKCDFILMASKWWENSPVVIQEAFYANRPLIVPNIGGMAEKVKDDVYGQWFNFNDAESLAMVMLESAVKNKKYNFPKTMTAQEMAKQYLTQM